MKKDYNIKIMLALILCLVFLSGCSIVNDDEEISLGAVIEGAGVGGKTTSTPYYRDFTPTPVPTARPTCSSNQKGTWPDCHDKCATGERSTKDAPYSGYSPCETIPITGISISEGGKYLTPSEFNGISLSISGESGAIGNWSGTKVKSASNAASTKTTGVQKGSGTSCATNVVRGTATNSVSSKSSDAQSYCVYCQDWTTTSGRWNPNLPSIGAAKGSSGCLFYDNMQTDPITGRKFWTIQYNRCCGAVGGSGAGTIELFYCYGDQPYIGLATQVTWTKSALASNGFVFEDGSPAYRYDDIENESECKTIGRPKSCVQNKVPSNKQDLEMDSCEGDKSIDIQFKAETCSVDGKYFYEIDCTTNVNTKFDMDDSVVKYNYVLHAGQGFGYNIGVTEKISCSGEFNTSEWDSAYGLIIDRLSEVKPVRPKRDSDGNVQNIKWDSYANVWRAYYALHDNPDALLNYINSLSWQYSTTSTNRKDWRNDDGISGISSDEGIQRNTKSQIFSDLGLAMDLEDVIIKYNNYEPPKGDPEETNLKMDYKLVESAGNEIYNTMFHNDTTECSPIVRNNGTYTLNNKPNWIPSPYRFEKIYEKTVNLYPNLKYIRKVNGKAIEEKEENDNVLDGGNKVYLDTKTSAQTIKLEILVSNLARNGSTIYNDKCELKIDDVDLLYRPVELKNPFINKEWKIGQNWLNSTYDLRNTIHANTWSQSPIYEIEIPKNMVNTIKNSNRNNDSAYLGVCDKVDSTFRDAGTDYICSFIK